MKLLWFPVACQVKSKRQITAGLLLTRFAWKCWSTRHGVDLISPFPGFVCSAEIIRDLYIDLRWQVARRRNITYWLSDDKYWITILICWRIIKRFICLDLFPWFSRFRWARILRITASCDGIGYLVNIISWEAFHAGAGWCAVNYRQELRLFSCWIW